jgi:hypothetical protein
MHTERWGPWATLCIVACLLLLASAAEATPAPGPSLTSPPVVIGIAAAGKRLTGLSGVWSGTGAIAYRYQWERCNAAGVGCVAIGGATASNYTLVARDIGKTVGLTVHATDASGTASGYASLVGPIAATRPPLVATVQPVVNGVPAVGRRLTVTTGTWSPMVTRFTYTWMRCDANGRVCAPIGGASSAAYTVTPLDLGHALVALVQAANAATLQNTYSLATPAVVSAAVRGPVALTAPEIVGSPESGSALVAATGRWQGTGSVGYTFQWLRCDLLGSHCTTVVGATAATYRLGVLDEGRTIALTVGATDLTGTSVAYASLLGPVAPPSAALVSTSPPTLSGSAESGGTLTVGPGTWSSPPSGYLYGWLLCNRNGRLCSPISGATAASFDPTTADAGHTLVAEVTARQGTESQPAFSAASAVVS